MKCCNTPGKPQRSRHAYDKRVTILQLVGTADAHGYVDNTDPDNWKPYARSYASVQTKSGREFWKVDRVEADVSAEWTLRYTPTLAKAVPAMRLEHAGVIYEIVSVIDVDLAHEEIKIQTKVPV